MFGLDPNSYDTSETAGSQALTVIHIAGTLGDFRYTLTVATDDSNTQATATGISASLN